jgi:hypothetical protein
VVESASQREKFIAVEVLCPQLQSRHKTNIKLFTFAEMERGKTAV